LRKKYDALCTKEGWKEEEGTKLFVKAESGEL